MTKPCDGCELWDYCWPRKHNGEALRDARQDSCGLLSRWLGQQETLKELAQKCGPKPCDGCDLKGTGSPRIGCYQTPLQVEVCNEYQLWLGQQQGYAKGLLGAESQLATLCAERDTLRKALERLANHAVNCPPGRFGDSDTCEYAPCNKCLAAWAIAEAEKGGM